MGDASYLVGDDGDCIAAVIDPQVDGERYVQAARRHGLAIRHVVQTHVHEGGFVPVLQQRVAAPLVADGFLPDLPQQLAELPRERPVAVYCDSGYRASIAASLLQAHGFAAHNVPGSWQAWQACGLPVE